MRRKLIVPGDREETLSFCVQHWLELASSCIKNHGRFSVALSGGSTPKAIYERLAQCPKKIDWSKVFVFWSDERAVPKENPESNFHVAMEAGFKHLPIPSSHVFRMCAEKEIAQEAQKYEDTLKKTLQGKPLDFVMLGMGDDGHTASLFPHTEGLRVHDRLVIANFVPQKKCWRMSLTFSCINAAAQVAVYVLGSEKKDMLTKIFTHQEDIETYPSQGVGTEKNPSLWIADREAAPAERTG